MSQIRALLEGLGFPESTRWRAGRAWVCNWGAGEVLAVTSDGARDTVACIAAQTIPFSIDWLPDGRMLVIDGPRRLLLAQGSDGKLDTLADLTSFGAAPFNELVVDAVGNTYVNGGPGAVVRVEPDGSARLLADGLQWPNGMALIHDDRMLVVADSHAEQLIGCRRRREPIRPSRLGGARVRARRDLCRRRRRHLARERPWPSLRAGA